DSLMFVLGINNCLPLSQVVRQRLFDIHVLAGRASVDSHRYVPMIRCADQHGVDIFAIEDLFVVLGGNGLRVGELAALLEIDIPDVENGSHSSMGNLGQGRHECPAPSAGANATDVDGFVGAEDINSRCTEGGKTQSGSRRLHERTTGYFTNGSHIRLV